jgi:hypothetical protein
MTESEEPFDASFLKDLADIIFSMTARPDLPKIASARL